MERRRFLKDTGRLISGAAAVGIFGTLAHTQNAGPDGTCNPPGCGDGNGGYWQHLNGPVHTSNANRAGSQMTLFKQGGLTNSYASTTVSSYSVPAINNLQLYGYTEELRTLCLQQISQNGGSYGPLTQSQINTIVAKAAAYGYTVTAAETSAINSFFSISTVLAAAAATFNTAGGLYALIQAYQTFNGSYVNWSSPADGPLMSQLSLPQPFGTFSEDTQLMIAEVCGTLLLTAWYALAVGTVVGINNPVAGGIIDTFGLGVLLEGAICETGGWMTFGDQEFGGGEMFTD